ncbi:hypothetical protein ACFRCR_02960 [Oerskovia sp. NPDC056781]|uniref:hypothetical protein n=1 Tax=Oerskovia sp. NPDC056781 TaxID=3345942 RepID=UPI0036728FD1
MTPTDWAVLILGSSLGSALISWAASAISSRTLNRNALVVQSNEQMHAMTLQRQIESHEAKLRREAAHDEARSTFLPAAESVVLYFDKVSYDIHWEEVGVFFFPSTERSILESHAQVLDAVRGIMWGHPTKRVRDHARALFDQLVNVWYDSDRFAGGEDAGAVTQHEANGIGLLAADLVQLIHSDEDANIHHDSHDSTRVSNSN